jgi:2-oxoglutarate dehydrogenase E1 component
MKRWWSKARGNKLMPDDFAGAAMTLTNPGGLGTSMSVPRLMAGQGSIIATGAIAYPPEFTGVSKERLADLGIAKIMTVTSTYDHRVIQGAESGEFLREVDLLLQGGDGFYAAIAGSLGLDVSKSQGLEVSKPVAAPVRPSDGQTVRQPQSPAQLGSVAAAMFLVDNYRTHGHLAAQLDPLGSSPRGDPALDPATVGLTDEAMAGVPADVLRVHVPGNTLAEVLPNLRATYCGTLGYEIEHLSSHEQRAWLRQTIESGKHRVKLDAEAKKALLKRLTEVEGARAFPSQGVLGPEAFLDRRRRPHGPDARRRDRDGRRVRACATCCSAWPTAAGSTSSRIRSAVPTSRSSPSSRGFIRTRPPRSSAPAT